MYGKADRLADKWESMKNRKQARNETVLAYFHGKVELCLRLKLGFKTQNKKSYPGRIWYICRRV